ncbi:MAG: DinB family protein [Acidobacteria bacterium]|nr:DinB family protein [Acidobacteriota bacterium]
MSIPLLAQAATQGTFEKEFFPPFDEAAEKVMSLAKAMPEEKYGWRPAPGVRSVSETYVHIANGNRLLLTFVSAKALDKAQLGELIKANADKEGTLKDKDQILAFLKASMDEVRKVAHGMSEADLNRAVKFFGTETTVRGIFIDILGHLREHLGQSIAYARMNGVTPPWSAGQ